MPSWLVSSSQTCFVMVLLIVIILLCGPIFFFIGCPCKVTNNNSLGKSMGKETFVHIEHHLSGTSQPTIDIYRDYCLHYEPRFEYVHSLPFPKLQDHACIVGKLQMTPVDLSDDRK